MRFFPTKVCTFPPSGSFLPLLSLKRLLIGVTVSSYLMTDVPFWSLAFETVKVTIPLYNNSCFKLSFQIFLPFFKCKALKITTIVDSKTQVIVWIKISMMLPPSYSSKLIYSTWWCFYFLWTEFEINSVKISKPVPETFFLKILNSWWISIIFTIFFPVNSWIYQREKPS